MGSTDLKPSPKPNRSTVDFLDANFTPPTLSLPLSLPPSVDRAEERSTRRNVNLPRWTGEELIDRT